MPYENCKLSFFCSLCHRLFTNSTGISSTTMDLLKVWIQIAQSLCRLAELVFGEVTFTAWKYSEVQKALPDS